MDEEKYIIRFKSIGYGWSNASYTNVYDADEAAQVAAELNAEDDGFEYWIESVNELNLTRI